MSGGQAQGIADFGLRNEKRTGGRADGGTEGKNLRRQTSPRLPFCQSPRLNNPQYKIYNPQSLDSLVAPVV